MKDYDEALRSADETMQRWDRKDKQITKKLDNAKQQMEEIHQFRKECLK